MQQRNEVYLILLLLLSLIVWREPATALEEPSHRAKSEIHHLRDWRFTLAQGDPIKGREVFVKFECYSCHEVMGKNFPDPGGEAIGPELSQMGPMHPPEFFAESILNPNAIVDEEYRAEDGRSKMPNYNDLMTVEELTDLAAFLKSLEGHSAPPSQGKHGH